MANGVVNIIIQARNLAGRAFNEAKAQAQGAAASIRASFSGIQGMLASLGIALGGAAVIRFLVTANTQFQDLQARLQTFTGSAESAGAVFQQLATFAAKTPFELQDSVEAFVALRSAGIMPTEQTLMRLGDQAAAFGGNIKDMAAAVRAATTGEMERLKQFGVVASIQGDKIIATFNGQRTTIGRSAKEITNYLETLSATNFGGSMDRQMNTLGGAFSNLQDNLFQLGTAVGEGGLSGKLLGMLTRLNDWLERLRESPAEVRYWTNLVLTTIKAVAVGFWDVIKLAFHLGEAIGVALVGFFAEGKLLYFGFLKFLSDATNGTIEALNKIPGVSIDFRMRDYTAQLDEAKGEMADLNQEAGRVMRAMGDDVKDLGKQFVDIGKAATTSFDNVVSGAKKAKGGLKATGLADGSTDRMSTGTTDPMKERDDQIDTLIRGLAHGSTARKALEGLTEADAKLREELAAGNLTLEKRIQLEELRAKIAAGTGGVVGTELSVAEDPSTAGGLKAKTSQANQALDTGPAVDDHFTAFKAGFQDASAGLLPMTEGVQGLDAALGELAAQGLASATEGFAEMFLAIGAGEDVFKALGKAVVVSAAQAAQAEGKLEMARGFAALAQGIFGNPKGFASAAMHFKAAAAFLVVGGLIGSAAGGAGGASGDGGSSAGSDSNRLSDRDRPETTLVVEGGILDMTDPRQAEALANAFNTLQSQRRIKMEAGR